MKILWLSHLIPYPPKGGVLQRSYHLLRQLARYHDVDLLAFNQRNLLEPLFDSMEQALTEADTAMGEICRRHRFVELPVTLSKAGQLRLALKSLVTKPYNINWLISAEYRRHLSQWLAEEDYDLIHFDTISLVPYFDLVPPGTETVLDHHNIESAMLLRRAEKIDNTLKKFYFWQEGRRLQRWEQDYCDRMALNIVCSDLDGDRLKEFCPGAATRTVPNGVDLEYFETLEVEKQARSIIFVGTLNWYPNIEAVLFLAKVIRPLVYDTFPDTQFMIIGANPPAELVEIGHSDPNFHVMGFVDDILTPLSSADVYVCPIKDGGGTKLKLLDAMAMALPIVADPVACEGIALKNNESVLYASSGEDYLHCIERLFSDNALKQQLGDSARTIAEQHYDYNVIGRELSDAYEALVRNG